MVHVTFLPHRITAEVPTGTTLLQAMIAAGLHPDAPCGGKGTCGKCRIIVGGETVLACKTIADRDMTVTIPESDDIKILTSGIRSALRADGTHKYAAAFDIGTTTVVGFLLDGRTGELLATASAVNPQVPFGADVIARIETALGDHEPVLQKAILPTLRELLSEMTVRAGISPADIQIGRAHV